MTTDVFVMVYSLDMLLRLLLSTCLEIIIVAATVSGFQAGENAPASGIRQIAPFDFDGDGKSDIAITRVVPQTSTHDWWVLNSRDTSISVTRFGSIFFDWTAVGDYTGDGRADIAAFRDYDGTWTIIRSDDNTYFTVPFGMFGDTGMPADYDGDGKTDIAVFRPSAGLWFILRSSDGQVQISQFGQDGDQPVASDYDGDGKADIAIVRVNAGNVEWWIQRSTSGLLATVFGKTDDQTVPGDYTGDGKSDIAIFRPSTGFWYILRSDDLSYYSFPWGQPGDLVTPGDYDGDGKFDAAVFGRNTGIWSISRSGGQGPLVLGFGNPNETPLENSVVRYMYVPVTLREQQK